MGLDAVVYCNCYETGRCKTPPPSGIDIQVLPDGSIDCAQGTVDSEFALDAWMHNQACDHEGCIFLHHYIGNIALVEILQKTLQKKADKFPMILSKVIYNGTHTGDYLSFQQVEAVREELHHIRSVECDNKEHKHFLDAFYDQMAELVDSALSLQKPIAF